MKHIFIFLFLISASFTNAQHPGLLGKTWNLEKVVLNNVEHYFPNSITTIKATANFTLNSFSSKLCNTLGADLTFTNNNVMTFLGWGLTLGSCPNSGNNEYNVFENYYFGQFFGSNTSSGIYSIYSYDIDNVGNNMRLTLKNPNGDLAIYWNNNLAVDNFLHSGVKVYPNPAKDFIKISTKEKNGQYIKVQVLDWQGRLMIKKELEIANNECVLNISNLVPGQYFIIMDNYNDEAIRRKIIKK